MSAWLRLDVLTRCGLLHPACESLSHGCVLQIDKEGANVERVKQELSDNGLLPEEWGGQTPMIPVSRPPSLSLSAILSLAPLLALPSFLVTVCVLLRARAHMHACGFCWPRLVVISQSQQDCVLPHALRPVCSHCFESGLHPRAACMC